MRKLIIAVAIVAMGSYFLLDRKESGTKKKVETQDRVDWSKKDCGFKAVKSASGVLIQVLDDESGSNFQKQEELREDSKAFLRKLIEFGSCYGAGLIIEFYDHSKPSTRPFVLKLKPIKPLPSIYNHIEYKEVVAYNKNVVKSNDDKAKHFLNMVERRKQIANPTRSYLNNSIGSMVNSAELQQYARYEKYALLITDLWDDPLDQGGKAVKPELIKSLTNISNVMLCYPEADNQFHNMYPGLQHVPSRFHFLEELKHLLTN